MGLSRLRAKLRIGAVGMQSPFGLQAVQTRPHFPQTTIRFEVPGFRTISSDGWTEIWMDCLHTNTANRAISCRKKILGASNGSCQRLEASLLVCDITMTSPSETSS